MSTHLQYRLEREGHHSVYVKINNETKKDMFLVKEDLDHGCWVSKPPPKIPAGDFVEMATERRKVRDAHATVYYKVGEDGLPIKFEWKNGKLREPYYNCDSPDKLYMVKFTTGLGQKNVQVYFRVLQLDYVL
eukprot:TRINITY_DN9769_c0_g1_i1.p1 TRINITY_DN9769_c0_g1~~TRINITY_DN9769_c0_g1_i1.p1  ORF type:complete len:148 (-),score=28.95 TRINITY_DN9769_c0_g1_i1:45-440(-)